MVVPISPHFVWPTLLHRDALLSEQRGLVCPSIEGRIVLAGSWPQPPLGVASGTAKCHRCFFEEAVYRLWDGAFCSGEPVDED